MFLQTSTRPVHLKSRSLQLQDRSFLLERFGLYIILESVDYLVSPGSEFLSLGAQPVRTSRRATRHNVRVVIFSQRTAQCSSLSTYCELSVASPGERAQGLTNKCDQLLVCRLFKLLIFLRWQAFFTFILFFIFWRGQTPLILFRPSLQAQSLCEEKERPNR